MKHMNKNEKDNEIVKMYINGSSMREIIDKLNTGQVRVSNVLKKNNIRIKKQWEFSIKIDDSKHESIVDMYTNKNMTSVDIAKIFNVKYGCILKILKLKGIIIKHSDFYLKKGFEQNEIDDIINLYINKEMTANKIGKKYNVSIGVIIRLLKDNNIEIRTRQYSNIIYKRNENYFEKIDNEKKAYFLGFIYADGNVHRNSLGITIQDRDDYILKILSMDIYGEIRIKFKKRNKPNHMDYTKFKVTSEKMRKDLVLLGCVPNKSLILKFPTPEQVPDHLIHHFIRGYFDGDGSIFFSGERYAIDIAGSHSFLPVLKEVLLKNGIETQKIMIRGNIGSLRIKRISELLKFKNFIYNNSTICLKRKEEKFNQASFLA